MAANAAQESRGHQENVLENYLEQAYRCGVSDAASTKLEDMKMLTVEVSRSELEKLYPLKEMKRKRKKSPDTSLKGKE